MRKSAICFFALLLASGAYLAYLYNHRTFSPNEFRSSLVHERLIADPPACDLQEILPVLSQSFSYLGQGKQMTAYVSKDGSYVLKFFNPRQPLKERSFHDVKKLKFFCSLKWFSSAYFKRKERLAKLFERYVLAFNELREETALVYVHVSDLTAPHLSVRVLDQDGQEYAVDLDETPFILQRTAELAKDRLNRLKADPLALAAAQEQLKELFTIRAQKGITDRIQTLHNNYGFIGDRAIQIDVGRIRFDPEVQAHPQAEVDRIMRGISD